MTPAYSIWLMPSAADAAMLQALVNELAPQFGQPSFVPHITIQGDLVLPLETVAAHTRQLAATCSAQTWPVQEVQRSDFFFRCLFLRFADHAVFDGLQQQSQALSGTAEGLSPYPHISLAYGQVQPHQLALVDALRARFAGRSIHFDRLSVCLSSKDTPIANWRCVFDAPLIAD